MRDSLKSSIGLGIVMACLALMMGASPATADELTAFLPEADAVFIQKTNAFPGIGDTLLMVQLSAEQIEVLQNETGRADFVVVGKEDKLSILRDDGLGGDERAGDGLFTGVAAVNESSLAERAQDDETETGFASPGSNSQVPVFEGRVGAGTESAVPFDAAGFSGGKKVQLTKPVVSVALVNEEEVPDEEPNQPTTGSKAPGGTIGVKDFPLGITPFQTKSLMVTHLSVVNDPTRTFNVCTSSGTPGGVWTFEHLMTSMANQVATGISPSAFVENWLTHSTVSQTINADTVPARDLMDDLIAEWRFQSGGGALNLTIAPFRLLAIVSRLDLATTRGGGSGYGTRTGDFLDAGEARFVFGLVLPQGWTDPGFPFSVPIFGGTCEAQLMTVIFEYRIPKCKCHDVRAWAKQWVQLSNLPLPSPAYNRALEAITEQFVPADSNPIKPNRSALGQLRTNEIALDFINEWELREFQLTQNPFTFLNQTTTADSFEDGHNNNPLFGAGGPGFLNWVMGPVLSAVLASTPPPQVPLLFSGAIPTNFLGANAKVPTPGFFWHDPAIPNSPAANQARFHASLGTCSGCHAAETGTGFTHIDPLSTGAANLSGFLTGLNNHPDPAFTLPQRDFDDLLRREIDIRRKARMFCFRLHPISLPVVRGALGLLKAGGALPDDLFEGLTPLAEAEQIPVAADMLDAPAISEVH